MFTAEWYYEDDIGLTTRLFLGCRTCCLGSVNSDRFGSTSVHAYQDRKSDLRLWSLMGNARDYFRWMDPIHCFVLENNFDQGAIKTDLNRSKFIYDSSL